MRIRFRLKLENKLLLYMTFLVLGACLITGVTGYLIARRELTAKGEVILKNSVNMALELIRTTQLSEDAGVLTREEAQEYVKRVLSGERQADGTRAFHGHTDLGTHGYFIVYGLDGTLLMHPTLEDAIMWEATDPRQPDFYLVQDQIHQARSGGGFTSYHWPFPGESRIGMKLAYGGLDEEWGWVVSATAYLLDFDKGAMTILAAMFGLTVLTILVGAVLSLHFVRGITGALQKLLTQMKRAVRYDADWGKPKRTDEIGVLIEGYNDLIDTVDAANSQLVENEQVMERLAYYDQLSGLPNRNRFKQQVEMDMAGGVRNATFILLDIRHFRLINTLQGEAAGDLVLKKAGEVLSRYRQEAGCIARLSGNEFGVWRTGVHEQTIPQSVRRFREVFMAALVSIGYDNYIDFRVGYARYPQDGKDFETCYKAASLALKRAKDLDTDAMVQYDEALRLSIARQELLRMELDKAIEIKAFHLVYQAKVDGSHQVVGVEALARWQSETLGPVSPGEFIPIVEKYGMVARFGEMILNMALSEYHVLEEKYGEHITLSINISPAQLFDHRFIQALLAGFHTYEVEASRILLEITENTRIDDFGPLKDVMGRLRELGVRFSLDDFGAGYASIRYIRQMPLEELKLDRSLFDTILFDPKAKALLKAVCSMARTYGMTIVAEGIETEAQEQEALTAGVDLIQGFLYSRPERL